MGEVIYFTEEQLNRFLKAQKEKDREKFNNQYPDKFHIDIIKVVKSREYFITDEMFDIYFTTKDWEKEQKNIENYINRDSIVYTDEDIKRIKEIHNMTEEETDEYIKDIKFENKGYNELLKKEEVFNETERNTKTYKKYNEFF